jgi:hypothetical protein
VSRLSPLIAVVLSAFAAFVLLAGPVAAYPSSTPNAAWPTAKVDAQLKPHFRALIEPRHYGYQRPSWSRWNNFYWRGDCSGYSQSCQGGGSGNYCDPQDPYCQQGGGYPQCDPADPYCQQQGSGYYSQPSWAGGDPYSIPTYSSYSSGGYAVSGFSGEHVTVDCRKSDEGRLRRALDEVSEGGTIHIKGRGPACTGTLQISRPVIIQGDPPSAFPLEADAGPAVITAPPGSPCAVIDAGPRAGVEFRDVIIEAPQGGRSACIQTFSSAVALVRSTVHYSGESSALYIQGGRLVVNDTEIDSSGYDAAIWSEDATIGMRNVGIATASSGFDVRPGIGQTISLNHVSVTSTPGGPNSGGPVSGIIGRRGRAGDCAFTIENSYIGGFRTGMIFEPGLKVEVSHSRVDQSRMGIAIDGAHLTMRGSAIDATEYGIYAYSGSADITGGYVTSVLREPLGADPGASIFAKDLNFYADGCGRWGRHDGWLCHERRETPSWVSRHDRGGPGRWGWNG